MAAFLTAPLHGGPDALGVPLHDFSTSANACGPCPLVLQAMARTDHSRYPDPAYTALCAALAQFHAVDPERIVLAASASEFIHRISAHAARTGLRHAALPQHGYGDYARAAALWGLHGVARTQQVTPALHWACEPASPTGAADTALARWLEQDAPAHALRVLDCAYAPLRLAGCPAALAPHVWQLWTPNKALGLTGVRAAYAIAPTPECAGALQALAPSWPVGADGVALLHAWTQPEVQHWLAQSRGTIAQWKDLQLALCDRLGWPVLPGSLANYFCARPGTTDLEGALQALRAQGIKLRDCASFGLPGYVRLGVLPPAAQQALDSAWLGLTAGLHAGNLR